MNLALIGILALSFGGETLGTAIRWDESIDAARIRARRENKLVLALHVSGRFDNRTLT